MRDIKQHPLLPPIWLLSLGCFAAFVWLLVALKETVTLLVVSYCIAYVFNPYVTRLSQRKIPRPLGVLIVVLALVGFFLFLGATAIPTVVTEYQDLSVRLPEYLDTAREKIKPLASQVEKYLPTNLSLEGMLNGQESQISSVSQETVPKVASVVWATLVGGYSVTLTLLNLVLLPLFVFYLAVDFEGLHRRALGFFPFTKQHIVRKIFGEIDQSVSAYVRGQIIVCSVLFVLYLIGLSLVGVKLSFLLAAVAGFGAVVPYLGMIIGAVLSSIMALVTFGDWSHLLQTWLVFVVVQGLEGTVITPKVMGEKLGLSPLIITLAIVAGGTLFGLLGVFLAVPGVATLRVLFRRFHSFMLTQS